MLSEARSREVVELTKALISRPSNSGHEENAAAALREYLERSGYDEVTVDRYGSLIGVIRGKRPGKRILFDGHIDTVPAADREGWRHDPYRPEVEDGKLYGRGASDMKGAVAAYAAAARFFAEDSARDFAGEICISGVVYEELFEGVAARSISELVKPDVVVIGEASGCDLKIGQRGRAEIVVETFGIPAHSSNPEKGVNAVYAMCRVVEAIRTLTPPEHPVLGKGILELTDIVSRPYPGASVVPFACRATYDRRLLTGETKESVLRPISDLLERMMREDPRLRARVSYATGTETCYTGETISADRFFPGWLTPESEDFVQDILRELRASGLSPRVIQYGFCTNGSHYAGEAGIPTVGMGPSRENLAHTDDEYVELEQLTRACESYQAIMRALLR